MEERNFLLKSTYQVLIEKEREIKEKIKIIAGALSQTYESGGGWHDNPQWDSTITDQEQLINKLQRIQSFLQFPVFIEQLQTAKDKATIGKKVTIRVIKSGGEEGYKIVGIADVEYNLIGQEGFISYESPLSRVFLGKSIGDKVSIELIGGEIKKMIILDIEPI